MKPRNIYTHTHLIANHLNNYVQGTDSMPGDQREVQDIKEMKEAPYKELSQEEKETKVAKEAGRCSSQPQGEHQEIDSKANLNSLTTHTDTHLSRAGTSPVDQINKTLSQMSGEKHLKPPDPEIPPSKPRNYEAVEFWRIHKLQQPKSKLKSKAKDRTGVRLEPDKFRGYRKNSLGKTSKQNQESDSEDT